MRNFTPIFSKLTQRFAIPLFTAYLSCVKLCATELQFDFNLCLFKTTNFPTRKTSLWRRFRKCMRKRCWLRRKTARIIFRCWRAVLGTLSEKSRIFPTAQLQTKLILFLTDRADLKFFGYFFQKKCPVGDKTKIFPLSARSIFYKKEIRKCGFLP